MKFWIEGNSDRVEMFIGEKSVGTFDHDRHGYTGMRDAIKMFEGIAKALGTRYEFVGKPE